MNDNKIEKKSTVSAWIWAVIAGIYVVSPIDIIPDIPVIGWVDDFFVAATGALNLIQAESQQTNVWLSKIAKTLKWISIVLGIIAILLIGLLGTLIVALISKLF